MFGSILTPSVSGAAGKSLVDASWEQRDSVMGCTDVEAGRTGVATGVTTGVAMGVVSGVVRGGARYSK